MPSTMKSEIYQPSELHEAVVDYFRGQIAAGDSPDVEVTGYTDFAPASACARQVLVEVGGGEVGEPLADGRYAQQFSCVLYAVISKGLDDAGYQAMNLASALARQVWRNRWGWVGQAVSLPEKISFDESFLIGAGKVHAGFEAWEVRWQQQLYLGTPLAGDDEVRGGIRLALNPVNPDQPEEYRLLEAGDAGSD